MCECACVSYVSVLVCHVRAYVSVLVCHVRACERTYIMLHIGFGCFCFQRIFPNLKGAKKKKNNKKQQPLTESVKMHQHTLKQAHMHAHTQLIV